MLPKNTGTMRMIEEEYEMEKMEKITPSVLLSQGQKLIHHPEKKYFEYLCSRSRVCNNDRSFT